MNSAFSAKAFKAAGQGLCPVAEDGFDTVVHFILGTSLMQMTLLPLEGPLLLQAPLHLLFFYCQHGHLTELF